MGERKLEVGAPTPVRKLRVEGLGVHLQRVAEGLEAAAQQGLPTPGAGTAVSLAVSGRGRSTSSGRLTQLPFMAVAKVRARATLR